MTQEDHVELVKTHTFLRKHATGKAKIELHVLQVERGMSWEQAVEKNDEVASTDDEGFWLSHQVRNGKKTAILAIMDETGKKTKKGKQEGKGLFFVYRPNTGQQVKQESLAELKKKYKKVCNYFNLICIETKSVFSRYPRRTVRSIGPSSTTAAPRPALTPSGRVTVGTRPSVLSAKSG